MDILHGGGNLHRVVEHVGHLLHVGGEISGGGSFFFCRCVRRSNETEFLSALVEAAGAGIAISSRADQLDHFIEDVIPSISSEDSQSVADG